LNGLLLSDGSGFHQNRRAFGAAPSILRHAPLMKDAAGVGVPANYKLLFGVSFGYEDAGVKANAARVGRANLDDAVRFHR
jgi:hypothetical protein